MSCKTLRQSSLKFAKLSANADIPLRKLRHHVTQFAAKFVQTRHTKNPSCVRIEIFYVICKCQHFSGKNCEKMLQILPQNFFKYEKTPSGLSDKKAVIRTELKSWERYWRHTTLVPKIQVGKI